MWCFSHLAVGYGGVRAQNLLGEGVLSNTCWFYLVLARFWWGHLFNSFWSGLMFRTPTLPFKDCVTPACCNIHELCWYLQCCLIQVRCLHFHFSQKDDDDHFALTGQTFFLAGYRLSFKQMCKDLPWCACICLANGQRISWNSHHRYFRRRLVMTSGSWAPRLLFLCCYQVEAHHPQVSSLCLS